MPERRIGRCDLLSRPRAAVYVRRIAGTPEGERAALGRSDLAQARRAQTKTAALPTRGAVRIARTGLKNQKRRILAALQTTATKE
jgi:hypothetical protein